MILTIVKNYFKLIIKWLIVLGLGYFLYYLLVCKSGFQIIQFIILIGIILAFLKEPVQQALFPPIFLFKISNLKPHYHEFLTTDEDVFESWLAVELKNIGFSSAKNVLLYFNGIESNRIKDFDAYQSLPIRQAFGESPQHKDPIPKPILVPTHISFFFSFCYIQNLTPKF